MKYLHEYSSESERDWGKYIEPYVDWTTDNDEVHYNFRDGNFAVNRNAEKLTFLIIERGSIYWRISGLLTNTVNINVKVNGGETQTITPSTSIGISNQLGGRILEPWDVVEIWSSSTSSFSDGTNYHYFDGDNGKFIAYGKLSSLVNGATTLSQNYHLFGLFKNCIELINASSLNFDFTSAGYYTLQQMFYGCTGLKYAPLELPGTLTGNGVCQQMFYGCTSLITAPKLPATTLQNSCYQRMFENCSSLTTAPDLPAITLANYCYRYMFQGCSKLNYVKAMFKTISGTSPTTNWLASVAASGTFVKNAEATWTTTGSSGVPSGWTVQTATS